MERRRRFVMETIGRSYPDTELAYDIRVKYPTLNFLKLWRHGNNLFIQVQQTTGAALRVKSMCAFVESIVKTPVSAHDFDTFDYTEMNMIYHYGVFRATGGDRRSDEKKSALKHLDDMTNEEKDAELRAHRLEVTIRDDKEATGSQNVLNQNSPNSVINSNNTNTNVTNNTTNNITNNITVHAYNYESIAHITTQEWQRLIEEGALHTDGLGHFAIIALGKVWELPENRNVRIKNNNNAEIAMPDGSYVPRSLATIVAETPTKMANFARAASRIIPEISELRSLPSGNLTVDKEGNHYECDYSESRQVVPGSIRPVVDTDLVGEMEDSWPSTNKGSLKMRNGLNTKRLVAANSNLSKSI